MSWSSRPSRALLLVLAAALAPGAAGAQEVREVQLQGMVIASRPFFSGGGLGLAWRDAQRGRWQTLLSAGGLSGGGWGARADLAWHFLLDPARPRGSAVYGGAGMSALAGRGRVTPYALLVLGAENAPGGSGGSFVEIGVGGGVRLTIGYRWRKRSAPGR